MKKIAAAGMGVLLVLSLLAGCGAEQTVSFDARVLEIREEAILVEPVDSPEAPPCREIFVSTDVENLPRLRMGDQVRICYNGEIAESSPAEIRTVYSIERTDVPVIRQ